MLYGDRLFVDELMQEVNNVKAERSIKIIFGSTIGSISRGIQRYSSDYDVRFLYVDCNNNFIASCDRHVEDRIRYRKFNDNKAYNCIAFWEISAFLNFLYEPYITLGVQYKLVRNVIWSFFSSYQYDPYGLSGKILPLLTKVLNLDCEINHHYSILEEYLEVRNPFVSLFDYFEIMHAYLSLSWIIQERMVPPLHIRTLMSLAEKKICDHINGNLEVNMSYFDNKVDLVTVKIPVSIYDHLVVLMSKFNPRQVDILTEFKKNKPITDKILDIIHKEINKKQIICRVNDEGIS